MDLRRNDWRGRVGAHATGVRTLIAVVAALVILRGGKRQDVRTADDCDEARFLAFEEFLDHDLVARGSELSAEHGLGALDSLIRRRTDDDALAGRKSVRLDHAWCTLRANPRRIEVRTRERCIRGGRNAMTRQEVLGEGLGPFELRGHLVRTETFQACRLERIYDTQHQ